MNIKEASIETWFFKGGGERGIAYMGAVEVLDEYRIVENIERVSRFLRGSHWGDPFEFSTQHPGDQEAF